MNIREMKESADTSPTGRGRRGRRSRRERGSFPPPLGEGQGGGSLKLQSQWLTPPQPSPRRGGSTPLSELTLFLNNSLTYLVFLKVFAGYLTIRLQPCEEFVTPPDSAWRGEGFSV